MHSKKRVIGTRFREICHPARQLAVCLLTASVCLQFVSPQKTQAQVLTQTSQTQASQTQASDETLNIKLPAGDLKQSLIKLVQQSGIGIVFDPELDIEHQHTSIRGQLSLEQALKRLLKGSQLIAEQEGDYYRIRQATTETDTTTTFKPTKTLEEVIVTGSFIKGRRPPYSSNIQIVDDTDFASAGSPTAADLIATLTAVSGTENQSNQFDNNNAAGTANVNLRGLGVSRTLVLINGRRAVTSALPHNDGQGFVDLNSLPLGALDRIEVLKDGAAATYGSDAVAGVINFVTKQDFEGFELNASAKHIDNSDGDWTLGLLWGHGGDNWHWMTSLDYQRRNELAMTDRSSITQPRIDLPSVNTTLFGQSRIGNPGAFIPIDTATAVGGITNDEAAAALNNGNSLVADPGCSATGGIPVSQNRCGYQFVNFDNLIEDERHLQLFNTLTIDLSDKQQLYAELLYARTRLPEWKTSSSFGPSRDADPSLYIAPDHPGLVDFLANYPGSTQADGDPADFSGGAIYQGRLRDASAPPGEGTRKHDTYRLLTGIRGQHGDSGEYDLSLLYSRNRAEATTPDVVRTRWQQAMQGLGGPDCSGNTPGANGCLYYNPFSSALASSPYYNPSLTNSSELLDWLNEELKQKNTSELRVAEGLYTDAMDLPQGKLRYALGAQYRYESLDIGVNDISNIELSPGEIDSDGAPSGEFIFVRGGTEDKVSQEVFALFGEALLPLSPSVDLQLALRFEDYGNNIGNSLNPKVAAIWTLAPELSLRASASTTFRAPSLNQTSLNVSAQELIGAALSFKPVDRLGSENLDPEKGTNYNLGLIFTPTDNSQITLDYWRIDLSDPIIQENPNAVIAKAGADPGSRFADQVIRDTTGNIQRVITHYINGPKLKLDGIDLEAKFGFSAGDHWITTGLDIAYLHRYRVSSDDLNDGFDAAGQANTGTFLQALPQWQGKAYIEWQQNNHSAILRYNHIGSYTDDSLKILLGSTLEHLISTRRVDAFETFDLYYHYNFPQGKTSLSATVMNLTDEDPPEVYDDIRFDSALHNAFGRTLTLAVKHSF